MAKILVKSQDPRISPVEVLISNITENNIENIFSYLDRQIDQIKQISDAVANAFVYAVTLCPDANPSDLWQHIIYRRLMDLGFSDQRWKRISGFALERVFVTIYNEKLNSYGLRLRQLSLNEIVNLLEQIGLNGTIKPNKIDLIVEGQDGHDWFFFCGVHVKASIAERIQDDVPASIALMNKGFISIALTMDSKSFPPPHGDGINWGELGGRSRLTIKDRPKRAYIEEDGQFDALFSFNLRTPESNVITTSSKRIYTQGFYDAQPDNLVGFLTDAWYKWKCIHLQDEDLTRSTKS